MSTLRAPSLVVQVDSWEPGAFEMRAFAPGLEGRGSGLDEPGTANSNRVPTPESRVPRVAIRRFRFPVAARVRVDRGVPVRVMTDRRGLNGGKVEACAGPWRASGGWWLGGASRASRVSWERDEWDVTLSDGATYRVFRERATDAWFVEGIVD